MFIFLQLLFFFSISIIIIVDAADPTEFAEDTLISFHGDIVYASVFHRHGHRAPGFQYETDPYKEQKYWDDLWKQGKANLSEEGELQMYNLGKWFNKRYNPVVKEEDREKIIKMTASDAPRAIESGQCFLDGFLFPSANGKCTKEVLKGPPPVEIKYNKIISFIYLGCARYDSDLAELNLPSSELRAFYSNYQDTIDYIAGETGIELSPTDFVANIERIYFVHDTLVIEESYGLKLPDWTTNGMQVYPEPMKTIGDRHLLNLLHTNKMRRLRAGPLIAELIQEMELNIRGESRAKYHFHFGHDTTLAGILISLGLFDGNPPSFGAAIIFELRRKVATFVVTILYKETATSKPILLQLKYCGQVCTFDNFKKLIMNLELYLMLEDWEKECKEKKNNDIPETSVPISAH